MAHELPLPKALASQGWKVKIFDKERAEEPHATIVKKTRRWRLALRSMRSLDEDPPPHDVPQEVIDTVRAGIAELIRQWNQMYPHNPVASQA